MRHAYFLWLAAAAFLGCGGNVATGGGGATTTTSSSSSSTTSSGTTSTMSSGTTTTGTTSSSSGSTGCDASNCAAPLVCCGSVCVNPDNDIKNCGKCGTTCTGPDPFCNNGTCAMAPCTNPQGCGTTGVCCAGACCMAGELCCDVPGPGPSLGPMCHQAANGTCPVGCPACKCNSPDTPIATPLGDRPIAELSPGDLVYSVDHEAIVAVPVARTHSTPAPNHHVVRLSLANGAVLEISAVHPTADGRTLGALCAGDLLDGVRVQSVAVVPYAHDRTYDILPASDTGTYFAGGVLLASTLAPAR